MTQKTFETRKMKATPEIFLENGNIRSSLNAADKIVVNPMPILMFRQSMAKGIQISTK